MPQPGDIGVVHVNGIGGLLIRLGQRLIGSGGSDYEHAVICIGVSVDGAAQVVQAMPKGADTRTYYPASGVLWSSFPLTESQRDRIKRAAIGYLDTPYSAADYFAIAAQRFGFGWLPFVRKVMASTNSMICSQLCVQCYHDAGIDLFPGRLPGDVTPGDLAALIEKRPA